MVHGRLVIVPCGQKKVWDKHPSASPTPAQGAYTGAPFTVNRRFAQTFGEKWVVLSAKYGFIHPQFLIPAPYNTTFKQSATKPIDVELLRQQVAELGLDRFLHVIGLGGKEYRQAIEAAFAGTSVDIRFPFSGLPIGKAMQATNESIANEALPALDRDAPNDERDHNQTTLESTRSERPIQRSTSEPPAGTVTDICQALHTWFNQLTVLRFPFAVEAIPKNGIYVLFESGETAHDTNRIVRVGTHTGKDQLRSRLSQHFVNEKKDRSIFRKNIGRCILNRAGDPFLNDWELDLTTRAAKNQHADRIDFDKQNAVERQVTDYITSRFSFVVFEVPSKDQRLRIESRITSTVSLCPECSGSAGWLGLNSPKQKIRESGLWQVNELYKTPFSQEELGELYQLLM